MEPMVIKNVNSTTNVTLVQSLIGLNCRIAAIIFSNAFSVLNTLVPVLVLLLLRLLTKPYNELVAATRIIKWK